MKKLTPPPPAFAFLIILFLLAVCNMLSIGQCSNIYYYQPNYAQTSTGVTYPCGALHTGNDIRSALYISGSNQMAVNVWDGSHCGLGWDDYNGHKGVFYFPQTIVDPDVVLVEGYSAYQSQPTWFAIVVCSRLGVCKSIMFEWSLANNDFGTTYSPSPFTLQNGENFSAGAYLSAINIDADNTGNFVIVWDDVNTADIQVYGGSSVAATNTPFYYGSASKPLDKGSHSTQYDISPDVAIYPDPVHSTSAVHYTFLTANSCTLYVCTNDFAADVSTAGSASTYTIDYTSPTLSSSDFYKSPRIGCPPNYNSSRSSDWSVAAHRYKQTNDIWGVTDYAGSIQGPYVYTDRSINCLYSANNYEPVVTYDANYTGIAIGWEAHGDAIIHSHADDFNPSSVIAITCSLDGRVNSSCYSGSNLGYMVIPNDNLTYALPYYEYLQSHLSMAGKEYNGDILYTFSDYIFKTSTPIVVITDDIYYKTVAFCDQNYYTLRKRNIHRSSIVSPNPFEETFKIDFSEFNSNNFQVDLVDETGQIKLKISGDETYINSNLNNFSKTLLKGTYFLKINYGEGLVTEKLIKM